MSVSPAVSESILDLVGNTPLVQLRHLDVPDGVQVFAKLEQANPTGSVKDRIVKAILLEARASGRLQPGDVIVEASTGNTGISVSMMGRLLGHKVKVCVPETVFPEIPRLLLAYGAEVVWVPAPLGIKSALEEARRLGSLPGHFLTDQFGNEANVRAHYETTAAEILADLPRVDAFVSGIGTGGTITGVGRRLKEANPACRVVGVEPRLGSHVQGLQSLDQGYIPPILDLGLLDGKIIVSSRHAFRHAREAMAREGILAGISAGACLHAAVRTARRMREGNLVTVFADGGWKYLGSSLWDAEPSAENVEDDYDDVLWW